MNLVVLLKDAPIRRKLMLIVILSAGTALLFAAMASMTQQWFLARAQLAKNVSSQAQIIAENSAAALVFKDPKSATMTLRALAAVDNIEFATIQDKDGKPFASYARAGTKSPSAHSVPEEALYSPEMTYVDVFQPVILEGERVGTLRVHSSMSPVYAAMAWNMVGLLAAVLGGLGMAMAMVLRLHPAITRPVGELVELMDKVTDEKNYALRAKLHGKDELGMLANGFNDMLAKIQARDDALAQRTARLMEAQRIAHLGNWEWDIVNNTLSWSDEIYRIFNLKPQQTNVTYGAFLRVVHPEDRQYVDGQVHEALDQSRPYSIDHRILLPDGTVRYVHAQAEVTRGAGGRAIRMVGTTQDITVSKLAEEQIRKQQEFATQIIETIPVRVFWKDRALRYLGCNTAFARDAGETSPSSLIGKDDFDLSWRKQAEVYRADDRLVMDTGTPKFSYDESLTTPAGDSILLRTSKVPLRNEVNEVIGVLGTYEDITEYAKAQKELEWKSSVLSAQQEVSLDAIFLVDDKARIVFYNRQFIDLWNIPEDLVRAGVDQPVLQTVMQQLVDPEGARAKVEYLYEHREAKSHEEFLLKDGRVVDRYSAPVAGADGQYLGRVWYFRDISERKQAEEKIRKLNQELKHKVQQLLRAQDELVRKEKLAVLGQVAGSVGHELRNPLGVMSNAVYFLQAVLSDADETTKEYLGIIKSEIAASERIVSDLLDSVRTKPPQLETVGVAQLIEETLDKCTIPPSVTVKLDIPIKITPLLVDAMQIHQVFFNLISNGVEAMPEGGILEIRAVEIQAVENTTAKKVAISVCDTGIGMTPEQLGKLFQPLFTTKARGIGLGLVVVKNLTQANGGSVAVESTSGAGSTFTVTLPCGSMAAETIS